MEGKERRQAIMRVLEEQNEPVSGSELARMFGVSRQVIVQDVALLRAENKDILSTARGYLVFNYSRQRVRRCYPVYHTTEQIEDELCTIVDNGGKVLDVIVSHEIYGSISVDLILETHREVADFAERVRRGGSVPLKELAYGYHFHTVEAASEEVLDRIEAELKAKGYLISAQ